MVTGSKSSFNNAVHNLFDRMRAALDKKNVDFLEVDGVANVLEERVSTGPDTVKPVNSNPAK
jgi:hypothetical protein